MQVKKIAGDFLSKLIQSNWLSSTLITWVFLSEIGKLAQSEATEEQAISWMDEWHLGKAFEDCLNHSSITAESSQSAFLALKIAIRHQDWLANIGDKSAKMLLKEWFSDIHIQQFLKVNRYNDILWYNRESFGDLLTLMQAIALIQAQVEGISNSLLAESLLATNEILKQIKVQDKKSNYQVMKLIN